MAPCGRGKAVLITVYVEKPQSKRLSFHKPSHSYHHILLTAQPVHGGSHTGYSKTAQLLFYTQQKRERNQQTGVASRPKSMSPMSSNTFNQSPKTPTQAVDVKIKPKRNTSSSCLGNWKLAVTGFFKSVFHLKKKRVIWCGSTSKKIKVIANNIQVRKKCQSIANRLTSLRNRK